MGTLGGKLHIQHAYAWIQMQQYLKSQLLNITINITWKYSYLMMCDTIKNFTIKNNTSGPLWIFQKGSQPIVFYFSFVIEIQIQTIENSVRLLFKAFLNNTLKRLFSIHHNSRFQKMAMQESILAHSQLNQRVFKSNLANQGLPDKKFCYKNEIGLVVFTC